MARSPENGCSDDGRFDPDNCIALCFACHRLWSHGGPSGNDYTAFIRRRLGKRCFNKLTLRGVSVQEARRQVRHAVPPNSSNVEVEHLKRALILSAVAAAIIGYLVFRRRKVEKFRVTFGHPEFWEKVQTKFEPFFPVADRLQTALRGLTDAARPEVEPYQKLILNLGIYSGVSMMELTTLVGNGFGLGAMKIARGMLENGINAEYLLRERASLDDYFLWHWVEQDKNLRYVEQYMPEACKTLDPEAIKEIEKEFTACKPRFVNVRGDIRGSWCIHDLAARSAKTEFQEVYRLIYPIGSKLMHGTIGGLGLHFKPDQDVHRIDVPPALDWCGEALLAGHLCILRMVGTLCDTFQEESNPTREEINKDFHAVWGKPTS